MAAIEKKNNKQTKQTKTAFQNLREKLENVTIIMWFSRLVTGVLAELLCKSPEAGTLCFLIRICVVTSYQLNMIEFGHSEGKRQNEFAE